MRFMTLSGTRYEIDTERLCVRRWTKGRVPQGWLAFTSLSDVVPGSEVTFTWPNGSSTTTSTVIEMLLDAPELATIEELPTGVVEEEDAAGAPVRRAGTCQP